MVLKILLLSFFIIALGCQQTEPLQDARSSNVDSPASQESDTPDTDQRPVLLFLGTSLTAGLGVDLDNAFPALVQDKIDSAGMNRRVVNAGLSGDTSAGGLRRVAALLDLPVDMLVLELGANDGLRGQSIDALQSNLQKIIDQTRTAHPYAKIVIAGMEVPPNMGRRYTDAFRQVFVDIASSNNATLIPFLLNGVGGVPELNQSDGIHPTAEGHRKIAELVWDVVAPLLAEPTR